MWILSWKTYKNCGGATAISIIGALLRYAGVMCFASMLIPGGLICIVLGIVFHFCAENIAKKKQAKLATNANNAQNNAPNKTTATNTSNTTNTTNTSNAQTPPPAPKNTQTSSTQTSSTQTSSTQPTSDNKEIKCPACGALAPSGNKFCNECGSSLVVAPKPKKCLRCGNVLEADDKFCGQCGYQSK